MMEECIVINYGHGSHFSHFGTGKIPHNVLKFAGYKNTCTIMDVSVACYIT